MFGWLKRRRRAKVRARPFPEEWREMLDANLALVGDLGSEARQKLEGHILVFLDEKRFEGCRGVEITDEIRVTVAAQACLVVLEREEEDYFPLVQTILVYPREYADPSHIADELGLVSEDPEVRIGESWYRGAVVLSWADAKEDAFYDDGRNVVLHEFAHQLDAGSGDTNGAPRLAKAEREAWARAFKPAYDDLVRRDEGGLWTAVDPYGAENPAEFFAVVTEVFFERPEALKNQYPDVYEQMRRYFRQDPAAR